MGGGGGPVGKVVKTVTAPLGGEDLLFGKYRGADPEAADIKRMKLRGLKAQSKVLGELEKGDKTAGKRAGAQLRRETRALRGAAGDAQRRIQELVARRGIQGSSIGLAQEVGQQRKLAEQLGGLQASLPERIEALKQRNLQQRLAAGGQLAGSAGAVPIRFRGGREGGIAPLLGAGIGAYAGGAGGAQAGMGIGQAAQGAYG